MGSLGIISRANVEESTLSDIVKACNTSVSAIEDVYECTPSQLRMIYETKPEVYQFVLSFGPQADIERFCEALRQVISLNPTLRTRFAKCQLGTLQVVLEQEQISMHLSDDIDQYLHDSRSDNCWLGVPLFRATFIGRKFVGTIHHAVMDYWSWFTMFNVDIAAAYYGLPPPNRPVFKEFVAHCRAIDDSSAKSFWAARFKGIPAAFPNAKSTSSNEVRRAQLRKVAFKKMVSPDIHAQMPYFIEAAWAITSSIYTGNDSVTYGYLLSGRSSSSNGFQTTLGPTVVEVPVQVDLQRNMTVGQLIKGRALSLRELQAHPAVQCGINKIMEASEASKHAAAYRTLLNILPELPAVNDDEDIKLDQMVSIEAPFPLHLIFNINDDGFLVDPRFDPEAISEAHLNQVLNQFEHVLQQLAEAPLNAKLSTLKLLNPSDRQCIGTWNTRLPEKPGKSIHEGFRAQARVRPDAMAVEATDGRADYRTLDHLSDRLAHELQRRGVSRSIAVAFLFERSMWAIVAILGILKAGGTCVPIDNNSSHEENSAICSRTAVKLVLTSSTEFHKSVGLAKDILAVNAASISSFTDAPSVVIGDASFPTDLAYILLTSGNAGESLGVLLEHHNLVSSLRSQAQTLAWHPGSRMLHIAPYVSSWSVCEVLGTLLSGGCLCIPYDLDHEQNLSVGIEATQSNWAILSSNQLQNILPSSAPSLKSILCIGNQFCNEALTTWRNYAQVFNGWGTCETSFINTISDTRADFQDVKSVGSPIGCSVWIANPQNIHDLAPIGSVGEILLSGSGVAKGYLGDETKTAAAFIAPPVWATSFRTATSKFYRTGDLGLYNSDGSISVIGRRNNRIKIKSRTVQLEDLERVLLNCTELRDVAVLTQISAGRTQVVAVVCLADSSLPSATVLQRLPDSCKQTVDLRLAAVENYAKSTPLADVMPNVWIVVEKLPWTNSGHLHRANIRQWLKTFKNLVSCADRCST